MGFGFSCGRHFFLRPSFLPLLPHILLRGYAIVVVVVVNFAVHFRFEYDVIDLSNLCAVAGNVTSVATFHAVAEDVGAAGFHGDRSLTSSVGRVVKLVMVIVGNHRMNHHHHHHHHHHQNYNNDP